MIAAPPGTGKTTLAQQIAKRLGGLTIDPLLGHPVAVVGRRIAYIAADRPRQAARSSRRMVSESQRTELGLALAIWQGPLTFDLASEPERFVPFLRRIEADAVLIDSLGAVGFDLASDEAGSRVAAALSEAVAEGIEVLVLHHDRKREQGPKRVRGLDDIYGSRWLTAAMGSVIYLDGNPGDLVVKLRHLKQPAEEVGPLTIRHDHEAGVTEVHESIDLLELAAEGELTVRAAAQALFEVSEPSPNEIEKARRRLKKYAERGKPPLA